MQKRNTKIMNTPPQLSLIISFYNKILILEKVLESIALQTYQHFEVIIADDGSEESVVKNFYVKKLHYHCGFGILDKAPVMK